MQRYLAPAVVTVLLCLVSGVAHPGQPARRPAPAKAPEKANADGKKEVDEMSVEELRAYQSYFYASGGRDPMLMRLPTDREKGLSKKSGPRKAPTLEEQEAKLEEWLQAIKKDIAKQDYDGAINVANEAMNVIDNEWPPIKPEHKKLIRMNEDIRSFGRMAFRLKSQQDIGKEFVSMRLRLDGVIWSPTDAKAIVNGKLLSAGEALLQERPLGDLRVEMIDEQGVVFNFKGMRYRLPVELQAPTGATEVEGMDPTGPGTAGPGTAGAAEPGRRR